VCEGALGCFFDTINPGIAVFASLLVGAVEIFI